MCFANLDKVRNAVKNFINTINKLPTQTIDTLCARM